MIVTRLWLIFIAFVTLGYGNPALAETPTLETLVARCDAGKAVACHDLGVRRQESRDNDVRDWKLAATAFQKGCDLKHVPACNRLGDLYYAGRGVPKNHAIAVQLYTRACDARFAEACFSLGYLTSRGEGVSQSEARAQAYYHTACAGGYLEACEYEANGWFGGDAGSIDPVRAESILVAACDKGGDQSCVSLAQRLMNGNPMPKDLGRARAVLDQSCAAKGVESCLVLGAALQRGDPMPKDELRAIGHFERACTLSSAKGCDLVGRSLFHGRGVVADKPRALALFDKACGLEERYCESSNLIRKAPSLSATCDNGTIAACVELANLHQIYGSVLEDDARAKALYLRACDGGVAASCASVAGLLESPGNIIGDADPVGVHRYYTRACDGGHWSSCDRLARRYADGIGVSVDEAKAATLYAKACAGGENRACWGKDRFAGLAPDMEIEAASADFRPPVEEPEEPPKTGDCRIVETVFEGKIFEQENCYGYVLNGFDVGAGSAPWQALIERPAIFNGQNLSATDRVLCGGSLIKTGWILTAAHCLYIDKKDLKKSGYRIRLGLFDVTRPEGISYPILELIPYKDYKRGDPTYANDLALIRYETRAPLRLGELRGLRSIRIDDKPVGQRIIYGGMSAYTYGWGWTAADKSRASATLKGAKLALTTEQDCSKITRFSGALANVVLCAAGRKGEQACSGDSGGPLIYYGDPDGVPRVIGVVSSGKRCGAAGEPSRYTRVSRAIPWINQHVWPSTVTQRR